MRNTKYGYHVLYSTQNKGAGYLAVYKKSSLVIGIILVGLVIVISLIQSDLKIIVKYCGYTGLAFCFLAALFSGALIDPDSRRVDVSTEGSESLNKRIKWTTTFLLIGLPNILTCVLIYFLTLNS
jgi:hypothetical protein